MPIPLDAPEVLNREFPALRAKLLQLAAALDRLARAEGSVGGDPRLEKMRRALALLQTDGADHAEQIQLLFSRPYEVDWQETLGKSRQ